MVSLRTASLAPALLVLGLPAAALPQGAGGGDVAHGDAPAAPASVLTDDARDALAQLEVGDGLTARLVASEPLLSNPVAFAIDVLGRFYVVETDRVHRGVTDMRGHMDWLDEDLAIRTVEDRVEMYRRNTPPEDFERIYGTEEDRIVRLVDTDGDGVLDGKTLFAGGFDDPADGIAAGVLPTVRADGSVEVWFTCIPSLYRMLDVDADGVADEIEEHSTGYGLRVALLGHDMHGLVVGPDGRLYFSIGDRGFNVVTPEGKELVRYGQGAVFRCELDGSNLELFCTGLRNPQELAFDDAGNLFTLDNNSDAKDQARWTFLMEGSDSGWRQAYQWIQHPVARGPWVGERMWEPGNDEQPAYITPPIANITNGPSGLVAYPGTGWGEEYDGSFFVCDFRGNPGYSGIWAIWNDLEGAGFAVEHTEKPVWNCLPTDVTFGPDGDLYWTDWISGWNGPGKGRVFALAPMARTPAERARAIATTALLEQDLSGVGGVEVGLLLGDPDRRVRMRAQRELAARLLDAERADVTLAAMDEIEAEGLHFEAPGRQGLRRALQAGARASSDPRRAFLERFAAHRAWLQAQVARVGALRGVDSARLAAIVGRLDAVIGGAGRGRPRSPFLLGAQVDTVLALAEAGAGSERVVALTQGVADELESVVAGLAGSSATRAELLHVLRIHIEAWGRLAAATPEADPSVVLAVLDADAAAGDPWIRHACVRALERLADPAIGVELLGRPGEDARLAGVVLLRRLGRPEVARALSDGSPRVRAEAARAIHDANIAGAMGALAEHVATGLADEDEWTMRRAIHANRAVADAAAAARLVAYVADANRPTALRAEALRVLARWCEPETRDGIVRDHRPLAAGARGDVDAAALLTADFALRATAEGGRRLARPLLDLHAAFGSGAAPLVALARAEALPAPLRRDALGAAVAGFADAPETRALVSALLDDPNPADRPLRTVALGTLPAAEAAERLFAEATSEGDPARRREAVRVLGALETDDAAAALAALAQRFGPAEPALVEWLEAARGGALGDSEPVAAALASVERRLAEATDADPLAAYRMCLEGGDAEAGRRVFLTKSETSCTRCHAWEGEGGSEAGPKLQGVGARLSREQILRSIVTPDAEIAEGYQQWLLALEGGEIWSGRIVEETDELVALETTDPETDELAVFEFGTEEIVRRRRDVSAMPADLVTYLSRRELRDLVAFLASLRD